MVLVRNWREQLGLWACLCALSWLCHWGGRTFPLCWAPVSVQGAWILWQQRQQAEHQCRLLQLCSRQLMVDVRCSFEFSSSCGRGFLLWWTSTWNWPQTNRFSPRLLLLRYFIITDPWNKTKIPWGCFSSFHAICTSIHTSASYCDKPRTYLSLPGC